MKYLPSVHQFIAVVVIIALDAVLGVSAFAVRTLANATSMSFPVIK